MNEKKLGIVCGLAVVLMLLGSCIWIRTQKKEVSVEPDAVSSLCLGEEQTLIIVANRDKIEDEEAFTNLVIKKYEENSFRTIRLSAEQEQPEKVRMKVYLWEEDFEKGEEPVMIVDYGKKQ